MEEFQTQCHPATSEPGMEDPALDTPTSPELDPKLARRLTLVEEHGFDSHDNPDPRTAALRCITSELMQAEVLVGEAFRRAMIEGGITVEQFELLAPSLDAMIRLGKTIAQVTQVEVNAAKCT